MILTLDNEIINTPANKRQARAQGILIYTALVNWKSPKKMKQPQDQDQWNLSLTMKQIGLDSLWETSVQISE